MESSWLKAFPDLRRIKDPCWPTTQASARYERLQQDAYLFRAGDKCNQYVLIADGRLRVSRVSGTGREIVLYRVTQGQTCPLSASILFSSGRYLANAIAETDLHVVLLPAKQFKQAFTQSPSFQQFVCAQYGARFFELVMLLDQVAFRRVDTRLAQWLLIHGNGGVVPINISQHELARELGTAREVISRQLKAFVHRGWVSVGRRRIQVIDQQALTQLASGWRN